MWEAKHWSTAARQQNRSRSQDDPHEVGSESRGEKVGGVGAAGEKRREWKRKRLGLRRRSYEVPLARGRERPLPRPASREGLVRKQPQREAAGSLERSHDPRGTEVGT
jgi:hypothetical protein